jgi:hypothetical protein
MIQKVGLRERNLRLRPPLNPLTSHFVCVDLRQKIFEAASTESATAKKAKPLLLNHHPHLFVVMGQESGEPSGEDFLRHVNK